MGGMESRMEIVIGRWSELREVEVDQEKEEAMWAEARETSGEDGEPLQGRRVGVSVLRVMYGGELMEVEMESPRESCSGENQPSWWALRLPNTSASPSSRKARRGPMSAALEGRRGSR